MALLSKAIANKKNAIVASCWTYFMSKAIANKKTQFLHLVGLIS